MLTDTQKKVLDEYNRQFKEAGYETRFKEEEGLYILQAGIEGLGEKEEGDALMELCFVPIDDEDNKDVGDAILFQIYTTFLIDMQKKKEKDVLYGLNEINMDSLLGAYGVYSEQKQIYHRYITLLNSSDFDQLKSEVGPALNFILSMVYEDFDRLSSLCR